LYFEVTLSNQKPLINKALSRVFRSPIQVTAVYGGIPPEEIVNKINSIDIWGLLIFNKDDVSALINEWSIKNDKSMYIVSGIDSYDNRKEKETEAEQAKGIENLLQSVIKEKSINCFGVCLHSFADNHKLIHSSGQDHKGSISPVGKFAYDGISDVEFFGIVKSNRTKKKAFKIVSAYYKTCN
jgi:hypothetical protein